MSDGICAAIRDWVRGGGRLFGSGAPAAFDEYGRPRGKGGLADVFGAEIERMQVPMAVLPCTTALSIQCQ